MLADDSEERSQEYKSAVRQTENDDARYKITFVAPMLFSCMQTLNFTSLTPTVQLYITNTDLK